MARSRRLATPSESRDRPSISGETDIRSAAKPGSRVANETSTAIHKDPQPFTTIHRKKTPEEVVEKILYLRRTYHMHPIRIVCYLQAHLRHSDIRRERLPHLPAAWTQSTPESARAPGRAHASPPAQSRFLPRHGEVDGKFLTLKRKDVKAKKGRTGAAPSLHGDR